MEREGKHSLFHLDTIAFPVLPFCLCSSLYCDFSLIFWMDNQVLRKIKLQGFTKSKRGSVILKWPCGTHGFHPFVGNSPWRTAWQPTPIFLFGESPWTEEPGGLQSMGSQRVRYDWMTKHSTAKDPRELSHSTMWGYKPNSVGSSWKDGPHQNMTR